LAEQAFAGYPRVKKQVHAGESVYTLRSLLRQSFACWLARVLFLYKSTKRSFNELRIVLIVYRGILRNNSITYQKFAVTSTPENTHISLDETIDDATVDNNNCYCYLIMRMPYSSTSTSYYRFYYALIEYEYPA